MSSVNTTPRFSPTKRRMSEWKPIRSSHWAKNMCNPIREIVETLNIPKEVDGKKLIPLSIGDPTVFGNLKMLPTFKQAIIDNVTSEKNNGYIASTGREDARAAVAKYYQTKTSPLTSNDICIASGGSGALEIALKALLSPGDNILLPQPGFALYETMVVQFGSECRYYNCLPERGWECDLKQMESLIDSNTKCILLNNPSNPCGSVFSKQHLLDILALAKQYQLPIVSDEIYGNMTFEGTTFYPVASLTEDVPVLAIGGTAKEFLVPGYRVGWIMMHDRHGIMKHVIEGIKKLSQLIIGSNGLVQSCLPTILTPEPGSEADLVRAAWWKDTLSQVESNATFTCNALRKIPGLKVIVPQGAMYVMVGIEIDQFVDIEDDMDFTQKLLDEEAVFVIPGKCFKFPNYMRIVLSGPQDKLKDAYERIANFCRRHSTQPPRKKAKLAE